MMDMRKTIEPKSDQLNADDLIAGPRTITITGMRGADDPKQPISVHYEGDNGRPYKPCKSMRRVMVYAWGDDGHQYVGKSMTIYCDPQVKFGKEEVGGIRISHMSHVDDDFTVKLTATRAVRKPYHVKKLALNIPNDDTTDDPMAVMAQMQKATDAAAGGTEAFRAWWNSDEGKSVRQFMQNHPSDLAKMTDEAKAIAADADDRAGEGDDISAAGLP